MTWTLNSSPAWLDGASKVDDERLLQIFSRSVFGPVFFESIQRKGEEGIEGQQHIDPYDRLVVPADMID